MGLPQPVITRQMVLSELIKAGINQEIAEDLAYRYYKNELTHKDIEYLKENFDIKLEKVEASLNNKIDNVRNELKSDIEKVESNLKFEIEKVEASLKADIKASHTELDNKIDTKFTELDNKIDNVENNLNNKIDKVETSLKSDIASVSNEVSLVRKDMEINKMELNSQLIKITLKLESSSKLHYWMFGTVITLFVGTLLTLIPIVYSILNK
ncbi:Bdr family repetitive protein (plasmid) [Borrelia miyamotoi]|uniref:Bdr family repetitive protein n=3 Tax=Borrelia miyamotoi TaxID=47466 RepID=A0AAQ3CP37_9SPIR|nr:Bdr family repetitive protein [Borrelia miyamotoi]ATQ15323.1 Bdr family repetitive protein [Borrelia miyamotoi]ATQ16506.1 Bdr family repetitive protein [Borrelia miyamotoi]ATQ17653.1 Bdr family repetitive protein [Borrelia miyamotoi]ATQ18896.1 Bdr family repetitive protein [Borrelia miyamotoi]ATQ20146.1 Bdr family repetitive protein [Borrelia miyamotoi]